MSRLRDELRAVNDRADSPNGPVAGGGLVIIGVCAVVLLILSIAGCIALLSGSSSNSDDDLAPPPTGGPTACAGFRRVVNEVAFGVIGAEELAEEIRPIREDASTAELSIRIASSTMLRRALVEDAGGFAFAVQDMGIACLEHGY